MKKYWLITVSCFIVLFSLMYLETTIGNNDINFSKVEISSKNDIVIKIELSNSMIEKIDHQGGALFVRPNNCDEVKVPYNNYSLKAVKGNQYLLEIFNIDGYTVETDRIFLCFDVGINHSMHPFNSFYSGRIGPIKLTEGDHGFN